MKNNIIITLSLAAVVLCAIALLPGSLGVMFYTHSWAATSHGAFFIYEMMLPIFVLSLAILVTALFLALCRKQLRIITLVSACAFMGISIYGFFMHTGLMFKPVCNPQYITIDEAIGRFGEKETVIGVLDRNHNPFAYIAKLQRRPHIVYQTEDDAPFISTHCILANSSMAYELTDDFSTLRICIASVVANNLVFYDKTNNWAVQQIKNQTHDGLHQLKLLPTVMTSLASWKRHYPESPVWIRQRGWRDAFYLKFLARSSVIDPNSPELVYPLQHDIDGRLPLKSFVMGVNVNGDIKTYPHDVFKKSNLIEDTLGGEPLVFFASEDADFVQLYSRKLDDGQIVSFEPAEPELFTDIDTKSKWTLDGLCIKGELKGTRLKPIPHYNKIFWFCWADFFPSTPIYELPTADKNTG